MGLYLRRWLRGAATYGRSRPSRKRAALGDHAERYVARRLHALASVAARLHGPRLGKSVAARYYIGVPGTAGRAAEREWRDHIRSQANR